MLVNIILFCVGFLLGYGVCALLTMNSQSHYKD